MTPDEARGVAAFLASSAVDAHFRALAGSTQVNATELRKLPLPPLATLIHIGERVGDNPSLPQIDEVVTAALMNTQLQPAAQAGGQ